MRASGAVLRGADLAHAVLVDGNFSGADLTGAHLDGVDSADVDLTGAVGLPVV
ncbi:pentapeptide repeat-containing protein [Saccharothrix yanglingensis]|uniref:pentapeptide repeat-containing protein n=1 Tax=Saccharothrix yanglingensis TaxID=659496 RepID=UPI003527B80B